LFWVVLPRIEPLAPARFDDDFAVRFFALFIFPLRDHLPPKLWQSPALFPLA
jgi:hypothetical protein